MSQTQILVFDTEGLGSPVHEALVESVWALPLVRVADLRSDYDGEPLDVAKERLRLMDVETVILQITETGSHCPLLDAWMDKVLALEPSLSEEKRPARPVVRRLGAVVVASSTAPTEDGPGPSGRVTRLLNHLRAAVESVGVEWLSPQIINPRRGRRSLDESVSAFTRRLQGRDISSEVFNAPIRSSSRRPDAHFAHRVARWSAGAVLLSALAQFALSAPNLIDDPIAQAWSGLVTSWLAVGLTALVASALIRSISNDARLFIGLAAALFGFQIFAEAAPQASVDVLRSVPEAGIFGGIVFFAAVTVLALNRQSRSVGSGPAAWPREG